MKKSKATITGLQKELQAKQQERAKVLGEKNKKRERPFLLRTRPRTE